MSEYIKADMTCDSAPRKQKVKLSSCTLLRKEKEICSCDSMHRLNSESGRYQ